MTTPVSNVPPDFNDESRQAREFLVEGSRAGSAKITAAEAGGAPAHIPFAAVLGCSDARVPVELVFNQGVNDLFVVRLAGEVLGAEGLGSLMYAVENIPSLRLLVVLGHTHCGAVIAAVKKSLAGNMPTAEPSPVDAVLAHLRQTVVQAAAAIDQAYGQQARRMPDYLEALIELEVTLNAAATAAVLAGIEAVKKTGLPVVYGVYDLPNAQVGRSGAHQDWEAGLFPAPNSPQELQELAAQTAKSPRLRTLLES